MPLLITMNPDTKEIGTTVVSDEEMKEIITRNKKALMQTGPIFGITIDRSKIISPVFRIVPTPLELTDFPSFRAIDKGRIFDNLLLISRSLPFKGRRMTKRRADYVFEQLRQNITDKKLTHPTTIDMEAAHVKACYKKAGVGGGKIMRKINKELKEIKRKADTRWLEAKFQEYTRKMLLTPEARP